MQFTLLAVMGSFAGIFAGFFGLGGAVIIVPALVFLFGFNQHEAQGTSLAMLLPPIGLLAVWRYWQEGYVNPKVAIILAIAFFIGAAFGAHFAVQLPHALMKKLFGASLILIGIFMMLNGR